MGGNASVHQVNPVLVSRIPGEGRTGFLKAWVLWFEQEGAGGRAVKSRSERSRFMSSVLRMAVA